MVEKEPQQVQQTAQEILLQSHLKLTDFKCFKDESHTKNNENVVINTKTGKLDCEVCMIG